MSSVQTAAVVYAKQPQKIAAFYERVANMRTGHADKQYIELLSDTFQLVILQIPKRIAEQISITSPPQPRQNCAIKLVMFVDDLASARETAATLGGVVFDVAREWQFQNCTVCDGYDPEGNVFQLRQNNAT